MDKFLAYMDKVHKGTLIWFVIFNLEGGAVNGIAQDATSYATETRYFTCKRTRWASLHCGT